MVSGYGPLLVLSSLIYISSASICSQGKQYLSTRLQICVNCTECGGDDVVLRPCELHRDTLCGPINEILKKFIQPTITQPNPHRHKHRQRHHEKPRKEDFSKSEEDTQPHSVETAALELTSTEAPFSKAETLVWDWQAIALSSAVFACCLFFLAITLYSLHQAKQWRRLKENFDAGKLKMLLILL